MNSSRRTRNSDRVLLVSDRHHSNLVGSRVKMRKGLGIGDLGLGSR